jgi:hypothetical protein
MYQSAAEIKRRRKEELKIIKRGGLEVLLKLSKEERELLEAVHEGEGDISSAVSKYTGGKASDDSYYTRVLAKVIKLQAGLPNAKRRLAKKYRGSKGCERAKKELKKLGVAPCRLVRMRKFDLLFAIYHYQIKRRSYVLPTAIKRREEELKIIKRGGKRASLELLLELDPDDYEIIQRVHGLGDYDKAKSVIDAVKHVKKSGNSFHYFSAMSKLVKLQAEHKLYKPYYKSKEATLKALEEANKTKKGLERAYPLTPAGLATLEKWELLYAAYYYKIFPKPSRHVQGHRPRRFNRHKYTAFERGLKTGITDIKQLRLEKPEVHTYIVQELGLYYFLFLAELFSFRSENGRMPTKKEAMDLPHYWVLDKYKHNGGRYDSLIKEWQPYFEKNISGVPIEIINKFSDNKHMGQIADLFKEYPDPVDRKKLTSLLMSTKPRDLSIRLAAYRVYRKRLAKTPAGKD